MDLFVAIAVIWIIGVFMVGRIEPIGHQRKPQPQPSKLARLLDELLR